MNVRRGEEKRGCPAQLPPAGGAVRPCRPLCAQRQHKNGPDIFRPGYFSDFDLFPVGHFSGPHRLQ
jgi:hypothetical protein